MNCEKSECLNEAIAWCEPCEAEYCEEHIAQCVHCLDWFCQWHIEKHLCKKTSREEIKFEENEKAEEEGEKKELMPIEETKKPSKEEVIEVHAVSPQKRKTADFNVINTVDIILEIHHIDVGQGDATLILIKDTKDNIYKMLLIDAGRTSNSVCGYLDQIKGYYKEKFRPLDYFFATHPDNDHVGGADGVLDLKKGYVNAKTVVYDNGGVGHTGLEEEYVNKILRSKLQRKRPPLGDPVKGGVIFDEYGVKLRCLAFNGIMSNGYAGEGVFVYRDDPQNQAIKVNLEKEESYPYNLYPTDHNDWSIALHLQFGKFSYFTAGDLSGEYEEEIALHINHYYGPVSAWKAGHHGAKECTSEKVVGFLQGRVCVFSFGDASNYGHPFQSPIDHLEGLNSNDVPCDYYCTGLVANRNEKLRQPGKIGSNGLDDQGTVIVSAISSEVKDREIFYVETEKGAIKTYKLKLDRNIIGLHEKITASESKNKAAKPLTEGQKKTKSENREKRKAKLKANATEALKKIIKKMIPDYDTLSSDKKFEERFNDQVKTLVNSQIDLSNEKNYSKDQIISMRLKRAAVEVIGKRTQ